MAEEALIIDVDGFKGLLDLLLSLSRTQKVDLRRILVLQLAEQYLQFVNRVSALRIELAADYLVMAAWLAYLKSRLLLPPEPGEAGQSADDLASHLSFQLERLAAMREAAALLMARDKLGRDFFARGQPGAGSFRRTVRYEASLLDLMHAYARVRIRDDFRFDAFDRENVYTMEQTLDRMRGLLGYMGAWWELTSFLPEGWGASPALRRSATAAHFAAIWELAKRGQIELKQTEIFAPLLTRRKGDA